MNSGPRLAGAPDDRFRPGPLTPADYMRLAREIAASRTPGLVHLKVGFLSSFTIEFVDPYFVAAAAAYGYRVSVYHGAFAQLEQELAAHSGLHGFEPDVLVIVMRPEDIDPDAVVRYQATSGARLAALLGDLGDRIESSIDALRRWSAAPVLVANFGAPALLPLGLFDANSPQPLGWVIARANEDLRARVTSRAGATIWDYDGLVRACGASGWTDRRLWALARIAVSPANQERMAFHLARAIAAARGRPAKCLVLDLDNTLWGGVLGDDGIEGIQLGDDFPGSVYKSFQRRVLALRDRGVLLAVASKNDPDPVQQVFRSHPEMLIRWEDLAATRIGWGAKSDAIREIATELNIGADAIVLFDDNTVERAEVAIHAPEVRIIDVPSDPLRYEEALWECHHFDQITLSEEDRGRAEMYRAEQERRGLQRRWNTLDEFLGNLEMVAETGRADRMTMARIAQLVNKTNQFNLTTRRRSQAELEALCDDTSCVVAWLRLRDRFGDQGLVAVGILRLVGPACLIDTLVMSCRVMGRRVEQALLAYLVEEARRLGAQRVVGEYVPSARNGVVRDLYPKAGFQPDGKSADGRQRFALAVAERVVEWPGVIGRASRDGVTVEGASSPAV